MSNQEFWKQISVFEKEIAEEFQARQDEDPRVVALDIIKRITGLPDDEAEKCLQEIIEGINDFYDKEVQELPDNIPKEQIKEIEEGIGQSVEYLVDDLEKLKKQEEGGEKDGG